MKPATIEKLRAFKAKIEALMKEASDLDIEVDVEALDVSGLDGEEYEATVDALGYANGHLRDILSELDDNFPKLKDRRDGMHAGDVLGGGY